MQEKIKEKVESQFVYYNKIIVAALIFIAGGAVFYHFVEKLTWLDATYFTVITLATIGYGDIVPRTPAGKIFTIFYVLVGITIFVALARAVLGKMANRRIQHQAGQKPSKENGSRNTL